MAVLISIQPKFCELIASGKKTIEARKTAPKRETPFKCYIYCTGGRLLYKNVDQEMVLAKSVKYYGQEHVLNCKIIGEFVCNRIERLEDYNICSAVLSLQTCLSIKELADYAHYPQGIIYAWDISDLKIYDKPKELGEFWKAGKCPYNSIDGCTYENHCHRAGELNRCGEQLTRPPQSWCYVEELCQR